MDAKPCLEDVVNNPELAEALLIAGRDEFFVIGERGEVTSDKLQHGSYVGKSILNALLEYYGNQIASGILKLSKEGRGNGLVEGEKGRVLEVIVDGPIQTQSGERRIIKINDETRKFIDSLTGLHNQNYWLLFVETAYQIGSRGGIANVILLDVDNLNEVNSAYGHMVGDLVLIEAGKSIRKYFKREGDFSARIGGDEFGLVVLTSKTNETLKIANRLEEAAASVNSEISRLLGNAERENSFEKNMIYCGISYGIAASNETGSERPISFQEAFKTADSRLYAMKEEKERQFPGYKSRKEL